MRSFVPKTTGCKYLLRFFVFIFLIAPPTASAQKRIEIVHAESLKFDKQLGNGAKRLIGAVQFKQDEVLLFCDSAYFYSNNSLDAFGHVHIQQGDSLHLYGDLLKYDGNTKIAVLNKNVQVNKGDMQLSTDALNYDVSSGVGYYLSPAKIISRNNILTSDQGYYYAESNMLNFKKNVVLTNPEFVINCDTMRYNTAARVTFFAGPTTIRSKENTIYCEEGRYDTDKDQSRFSKNAYILTKSQKMLGDSLFYDRKKGIGKAFQHVNITDTTQNIIITGELAEHNEIKDVSVVTGNALLQQLYEKDTLFLHADTLKAAGGGSKKDIRTNDSLSNQQLFAYHHVKFFKNDVQGKCDSLVYTVNDSLMQLFGTPTLWNDENQLSGDSMRLSTGKSSLKNLTITGTGFIVSKEDSLHFNQIRGKIMHGYFKDNRLNRVNVEGNGQTIYFAKDKGELKAVNRADCSDLHIYLKDNQIDHITFVTKPEASLYPLNKIDIRELKLKDFTWREKYRPKSALDIFSW